MSRPRPIAIVNGITAIVETLVALAVGFGLDLSAEQLALVMAAVIAVANVFKTWFGQSEVTPNSAPQDEDGRELVALEAGDR